MEFSLDNGSGTYQLKAYDNGYFKVNDQTYNSSILIAPEYLMAPWRPSHFEALLASDFEGMLAFDPQVVLLGTGKTLRFPHPQIFSLLIEHKIGFEVMNTAAACRTYTVLMAEGRRVVCGLLP